MCSFACIGVCSPVCPSAFQGWQSRVSCPCLYARVLVSVCVKHLPVSCARMFVRQTVYLCAYMFVCVRPFVCRSAALICIFGTRSCGRRRKLLCWPLCARFAHRKCSTDSLCLANVLFLVNLHVARCVGDPSHCMAGHVMRRHWLPFQQYKRGKESHGDICRETRIAIGLGNHYRRR